MNEEQKSSDSQQIDEEGIIETHMSSGDKVEKIWKITKDLADGKIINIAGFVAIIGVLSPIILTVPHFIQYYYILGRFNVFHIDRIYIDLSKETYHMEIIEKIIILFAFALINIIAYWFIIIPIKGRESKIIRLLVGIVRIVFFLLYTILVGCFLITYVYITAGFSFDELGLDFIVEQILVILILAFLCELAGIYFGIVHRIEDRKKIKKSKRDNQKKEGKKSEEKEYSKKWIGIAFICTWAICMLMGIRTLAFSIMKFGEMDVKNQKEYKMVYVKEKEEITEYAVVFENEDKYFLAQVIHTTDEENKERVYIDSNVQNIIDKDNVITRIEEIDGIYEESNK